MREQRLHEPSFSELVVMGVEGLGDSIGEDRQQISSGQTELRRPAKSRDCTCIAISNSGGIAASMNSTLMAYASLRFKDASTWDDADSI